MALQVVDRTMQAFGAEGLSQDQELAFAFANLRTLRIADVSCLVLIVVARILTPTLPFRALMRSVSTRGEKCCTLIGLFDYHFRFTYSRSDNGS